MSHSPNLIRINRIASFLLFDFFIDSSVVNSSFEKITCIICDEIGDFISFSKFTGSLLNIQNGGLHWLNGSQNFDFLIALTF